MPTAKQIAQFRAIKSASAMVPANDDQPKGKLKLADFVGTLDDVEGITIPNDAAGNPYIVLKGATVTSVEGKTLTRTVMAFEACEAVRGAIGQPEPLTATFRHTGGTLKIVGVLVDGEMVSFDRPAAAAA